MSIDVMLNRIRRIQRATKAVKQTLKAYGYASPYTRQAAYSLLLLIEQEAKVIREQLEQDHPLKS